MLWSIIVSVGMASPEAAVPAYLDALSAFRAGDVDAASAGAQAALVLDPGLAPARLLLGFAAVRAGDLRGGDEVLGALAADPLLAAADPEVSALARRYVATFADRWSRDDLSVALGPAFVDAREPVWSSVDVVGVGEVQVPLGGPVAARLDGSTVARTWDALALRGPVVSALAVVSMPLGPGVWSVDAGLGPSVWIGRSERTDGAWDGAFPGARGAAALSVRPVRRVGARAELGYAAHFGARPDLGGVSHGADVRLLAVGWAP
jgi:hypothetical protein